MQVYVSIHSGIQGLLGQQSFKWTLRSGGGGSDLNVQLTLSGEKVNMSTALTGVTTISNGNSTEWSPIRSLIIRVINKIG